MSTNTYYKPRSIRPNFYIYYDNDGNMPELRFRKADPNYQKPFWIRYVNDRPVEYRGPKDVLAQDTSGTKVWDYAAGQFVPIDGLREV